MNSLNPVLRIGDQIDDLLRAHGVPALAAASCAQRIGELLARVGLAPEVADLLPARAQRRHEAARLHRHGDRAAPAVIIADEPTSALDVVVQKQVLRRSARSRSEIGAAVILVGHDMGLMAQFATAIGVMYAGRLVEIGPVRDIFADPAPPLHADADREPALLRAARRVQRHPRHRAVAARPAARLPLPSALPARRGASARSSAAGLAAVGDRPRSAACHFAPRGRHDGAA